MTPARATGPSSVRNDKIRGGQKEFTPIQRAELFSFSSCADDDASVDLIGIKSMERLAKLEHHVVCDVHDIVDRAKARPLPDAHEAIGGWGRL